MGITGVCSVKHHSQERARLAQSYLAHTEGECTGDISWKIDLASLPAKRVTIDLGAFFLQDDGRIVATACFGDVCHRIGNDGHFASDNVASAAYVEVSVHLAGGKSWQHAQLFRSNLDDDDVKKMCIKIELA